MLDYSYLFDFLRDSYAKISYNNPEGKALLPLRYTLELTYNCNLRCPYCYVGDNRAKKELTTNEWFNIIEQIPGFGFISLVGGEPLLRNDFVQILEKATKQVFGKVNVVSNGVLINEELINAFIKYKLLLLSVSLDGYGENHDKNRGKDGIFDKIIANLELLQSKNSNNKPMIDIKTIVLENNLEDLPKLYKLISDMNVKFFSIAFKRNNHLKQNSCLRETFTEEFYLNEYPIEPYFDMEQFKEVYKELESISKTSKTVLRWAPKFNPIGDIDRIEKYFNSGNKTVSAMYKPCLHPFSNMYITPEGNTYPCLSYKTGNLVGKNVKDAFNSVNYKCFRKNLKASEVFNACQLCCELTPKSL